MLFVMPVGGVRRLVCFRTVALRAYGRKVCATIPGDFSRSQRGLVGAHRLQTADCGLRMHEHRARVDESGTSRSRSDNTLSARATNGAKKERRSARGCGKRTPAFSRRPPRQRRRANLSPFPSPPASAPAPRRDGPAALRSTPRKRHRADRRIRGPRSLFFQNLDSTHSSHTATLRNNATLRA